jgi:hypothetical protein
MHLPAQTLLVLLILWSFGAGPVLAQGLSVAAATGPVLLPGARSSVDWAGLLSLDMQPSIIGVRLEGMYTGVPGADLVAFTGNLLWSFQGKRLSGVEPYLIAGVGSYVKFSESRFGVNGGLGVRRRTGPVRLLAEVRFHRVTRRFEEAGDAATFIPLLVGVTVGN